MIWNPSDGKVRLEVSLALTVTAVSWSPDGDLLAVCVEDMSHLEPIGEEQEIPVALYPTDESTMEEDKLLQEFSRASPLREGFSFTDDVVAPMHIRILDADSGLQIASLGAREVQRPPVDVTWLSDGQRLVTGSDEGVAIWSATRGHFLGWLEDGRNLPSFAVSTDWSDETVVAATRDGEIVFWETDLGVVARRYDSELQDVFVSDVAPGRKRIAIGSESGRVEVWDFRSEDPEIRALEGHTDCVTGVSFSADGRLLATTSLDGTVKLWSTLEWSLLSTTSSRKMRSVDGLVAFSPVSSRLASVGNEGREVNLWDLDLGTVAAQQTRAGTVHYANAKVVLVGDSGVGKSGLGLVLAGEQFRATESTHQRNVWMLSSDRTKGSAPQRREVFLWDLAGQPGYRVLHQLHLADVAVALVVFDARSETGALAGVRHWARSLTQAERKGRAGGRRIERILVAARMDRGGAKVNDEDLRKIRSQFGFDHYVTTSAKEDIGVGELVSLIEGLIEWDALPVVSSSALFEAIRAFLIEKRLGDSLLMTERELRKSFEATEATEATNENDLPAEFRVCVDRAEARDLVRRLSFGDLVLLQPEVLDAYAAAVINAAANQSDGLGAIPERTVQQGAFFIPPESRLGDDDLEQLLLIATIEDLLHHELALREDSGDGPYLVFPTQSTRSSVDVGQLTPWCKTEFEGQIPLLWATLVVRLAHSGFFVKDVIGAQIATFQARGRILGVRLTAVDEGKGRVELLSENISPSEAEDLFDDFVFGHLERRGVRGSISRAYVCVCPDCEFVVPDELVAAMGNATEFNCPRCPAEISVDSREDGAGDEGERARKVGALQRTADEERARVTARTAVQGKEAVREFDVFLAHNHRDREDASILAERLRDQGLSPWLDREQIPPGRWFQDVIQDAIRKVRTVAVLIGGQGLGKWQAVELRAFVSECVEGGLPVIPVLLPKGKFPDEARFLKEFSMVSFAKEVSEDEPFAELVWGISGSRALRDQILTRQSRD